MRDWIDVATLAKCKNMNGRFAVNSTAGLPFLLMEGDSVAFVPPRTDVPRTGIVADVRLVSESRADVTFEGIEGDAARELVGCHCLIRRDEIDPSVFEEAPGMWDGWKVVDAASGEIGEVSGLVENPGQSLLEVTVPGRADVLLVPLVDEIVRDVDVAATTVHVDLPAGLLEL